MIDQVVSSRTEVRLGRTVTIERVRRHDGTRFDREVDDRGFIQAAHEVSERVKGRQRVQTLDAMGVPYGKARWPWPCR